MLPCQRVRDTRQDGRYGTVRGLLESEEVFFLGLEHGVEFLDELVCALLEVVLSTAQ